MIDMYTTQTNDDPWEAYRDIESFGKLTLSNIEITTTTLCNMRCEHCAVGYTLSPKDPDPLPLSLLIRRLDEIPHLRAFSITGGEPMMSLKSVKNYVEPLLRYAHERGAKTQINSNLTMPLERYTRILPYLDVLHISHNYGSSDDFVEIGFANAKHQPSTAQRKALFHRMVENAQALSAEGVFISAETMLNKRTLPYLERIHEQIIHMGCKRHEIHPMYPSDFASSLEVASLHDIRAGIHRLLDCRNKNIWMLFGTLPFYPCSENPDDLALQERLYSETLVTVRNDPDGRSRLNVNLFSGDIIVTDFGDVPELGNIQHTSFLNAFQRWQSSKLQQSISCHCPTVKCLGPNLLVKDAYYKDVDFLKRTSQLNIK
ncbi:radical SAM/CxCxxxxC motif protein YfkAB [Shouchella lonarensis]|uniref:Radical SAM/CxCxxxxC motif protein YfkAB n=1 Tax=Shouchella lonarensis TaxID=1464122 RepID=A0A1G6GGT3_9BACI|nr:radical SAM/CxCxxxxC motif protein YfkAB [Shouchella lonarensis]SDB81033.1 radical SAM/CxCxxxxC motif protein YfkAB [Shouchella lonarensis]